MGRRTYAHQEDRGQGNWPLALKARAPGRGEMCEVRRRVESSQTEAPEISDSNQTPIRLRVGVKLESSFAGRRPVGPH